MNSKGYSLLLLLFVSNFALLNAQTNNAPFLDRSSYLLFDPQLGYSFNKVSENVFLDGKLGFRIVNDVREWRTSINFNQRENFNIVNPRIFLDLSNRPIIVPLEDLRARPDSYSINNLGNVGYGLKHNRWTFSSDIFLLTEETVIERPTLVENGDSLFIIDFVSDKNFETSILSTVDVSYGINRLTLTAGFRSFPIANFGSIDDEYEVSRPFLPTIALRWTKNNHAFSINSSPREVSLNQQFPIQSSKITKLSPILLSTSFYRGLGAFNYNSINVTTSIPLSISTFFHIRYFDTWASDNVLSISRFSDWQRTLTVQSGRKIYDRLPHRSLMIGLEIPINKRTGKSLKLTQFDLIHSDIFSSRRSYYSENPIGIASITNAESSAISIQISAKTNDGLSSYQSDTIWLEAGQTTAVPIYLFLPYEMKGVFTSKTRLEVFIETNEKRSLLSTQPIVLHGPNNWNGSIEDLSHFVTPNNTLIQSDAKTKYLDVSAKVDSTKDLTPTIHAFNTLRSFIQKAGNDVAYINDPTSTLYVDQVQYPIETINSGGGDCEDLVVYIASYLMGVGHHVSVVDIRPQVVSNQQNKLGHLFVLIDTNIKIDKVSELGLEEFQYVSRTNNFGEQTIWLPIETTVLDQGFEAAWKAGTKQYYDYVILKKGAGENPISIHNF